MYIYLIDGCNLCLFMKTDVEKNTLMREGAKVNDLDPARDFIRGLTHRKNDKTLMKKKIVWTIKLE